MYAIVTAGGIPAPGESLHEYTRGQPKALLDIAGKPMIQWVLDALSEASTVQGVLVMGLDADSGVTCKKPLYFAVNQGSMLENILGGVDRVLQIEPQAHHVVLVSSDIPAIRPEMIDWVVNTALETDHDVYYNVITRQAMETRFPNSNRTYTRLKDMELCGGDMNVVRTMSVKGKEDILQKIIASRKNPLKQAAMIGFDTLLLVLLRQIDLDEATSRVTRRLGFTGRAVVCPYAEVGMDVDKLHQLEIVRSDLAGRGTG